MDSEAKGKECGGGGGGCVCVVCVCVWAYNKKADFKDSIPHKFGKYTYTCSFLESISTKVYKCYCWLAIKIVPLVTKVLLHSKSLNDSCPNLPYHAKCSSLFGKSWNFYSKC